MNMEEVGKIMYTYKTLQLLPPSDEKNIALKSLDNLIKDMIREKVFAFCSFGEVIGFDYIEKTLEETKQMIKDVKKMDQQEKK